MTARPTPRSAAEWGVVLPIYVGLAGIVACFVVWTLFNRVEPVMLGAFGTLVGLGQGADVLASLRSDARIAPTNDNEEPR